MKHFLEKPNHIIQAGSRPSRWSMRRFALLAGVLVFAALAVQLNPFGRGITGSIPGTVTEATGAAVASATVTVTQTSTNAIHAATTSAVGSFTVTQLPPGQYAVKVDMAGF